MSLVKLPALVPLLLLVPFVICNPYSGRVQIPIESIPDGTATSSLQDLDQAADNATASIYPSGEYNFMAIPDKYYPTFHQAYLDMMVVINKVIDKTCLHGLNNPALDRYFNAANQREKVCDLFITLKTVGTTGWPSPNPLWQINPINLDEIKVSYVEGSPVDGVVIAEAFDAVRQSLDPRISVYTVGWHSLYKRLISELTCADIGPKTDYKMSFLGMLLLHETLHFNSITNIARGGEPGQWVDEKDCLDDQDGNFPFTKKAYGPYESIQLRQRQPATALRNIENYVWFAIETYWADACPARLTNGQFVAPTDNNALTSVCRYVQGIIKACAQW